METRISRGISMVAALAVLISVILIAPPATATFLNPGIPSGDGVTPVVRSGFPGCAEGLTTYTWDGKRPGIQTTPDGAVITVSRTGLRLPGRDSRYFDYSVDGAEFNQVIVKTDVFFIGFITGSNVYTYDEPSDADTKLHPPADRRNRPFMLDGIRFCYEPGLDISGTKFHDLDANGTQDDGEPGLEGWEIVVSQDEEVVATTETGSDGSYAVEDLEPGIYEVCETPAEGWIQSYPAGDECHTVSTSTTDADFGNYQNGSISGRKFEDANANGVDDEDPGLSGWTITASNGYVFDTTTAGDGSYTIADVTPGTYAVCEEAPEGEDDWTQSLPGTESECYGEVLIESGDEVVGKDFGNFQAASISGGRFLNGEGFPSQEVVLIDSEGASVGDPVFTATDGSYSFSDLLPGDYSVCTGDLGDTVPTSDAGDCDEGSVGTAVTVESGDAVTDVDFNDTVEGASVGSCSTDGASTEEPEGFPEGTASSYCETKDGEPLDSIAIVYRSAFDEGVYAQVINLEILGTPIITQFVETLDFVPTPRTSEDPPEPVLEYDDGSGPRIAELCKLTVDPGDLPVADPDLVLPDGETLCILMKTLTVVDPPDDAVEDAIYVDVDFDVFWTQDPIRGFR